MTNDAIKEIKWKIKNIINMGGIVNDTINADDLMEKYALLLQKWMRIHNIVSKKKSLVDIWENIYDSLIICGLKNSSIAAEFAKSMNIVDAGAGGGFPGIPLAINFPEKKFLLVDINRKKISFLRSVKSHLGLNNISICESKVEDIQKQDFIITKAAFSPENIGILPRVQKPGGHLLIWASTKMREAFENQLKKHGVFLEDEYVYSFGSHAQRSLLLFVKQEG